MMSLNVRMIVEHFNFMTGPVLDEDALETILRESVVMSSFNHPRLVSLIGLCLNSQTNPVVILPFMLNGNLRTYIKDRSRVVTMSIPSFCYKKIAFLYLLLTSALLI